MNHDRRKHPRLIPEPPLLVSLGQSKRGFLSDLSESGLAFSGFPPAAGNNVIFLAFDLPDGGGPIEVIAEVVWTSNSLRRTGVRFLEVADASRRHLRQWISSRVFTLVPESSEERESSANQVSSAAAALLVPPQPLSEIPRLDAAPEPVQARFAVNDEQSEQLRKAPSESLAHRGSIHAPRRAFSLGIVLAIILISSACVALGYYLPGMIYGRNAKGVTTASDSLLRPAPHAIISSVPPAQTKPVSASVPPADADFVLQVAAMARPENANALVEKLRQKNFPAFVLHHGGDAFYRVHVGPYKDASYARSVQDDLKTSGFNSILQRWSPPSSN